jgi:sterol desaturase/sphingolipid hydroxylase (fatty acid hydroxylase superfamily)
MDENLPLAPQLFQGVFSFNQKERSLFGKADTAAYENWIYEERGPLASPILFGGPVELLSRNSPLFLVLVWVPVILYLVSQGFFSSSLLFFLSNFALGVFFWSIMEYTLHRFFFHSTPTRNWGVLLHFIFHGIHHRYPTDAGRLLMPPLVGLLVLAILRTVLLPFLSLSALGALLAGCSSGYCTYDLCHYLLHHHRIPLLANLQRLHKDHHRFHSFNFGVSPLGRVWDRVFCTGSGSSPH